jgi:hypothetical protein
MKAEQKAILRNRILSLLGAAGQRGLTIGPLHVGCTLEGFNVSPDQLDAEIESLEAKGLLAKEANAVNDAIIHFHITPAGMAHLEKEGLA